jgi:ELWxxDGT repeat protein
VHGTELWKSDGSEAGTVFVRHIYPEESGTSIFDLVVGPTMFT